MIVKSKIDTILLSKLWFIFRFSKKKKQKVKIPSISGSFFVMPFWNLFWKHCSHTFLSLLTIKNQSPKIKRIQF